MVVDLHVRVVMSCPVADTRGITGVFMPQPGISERCRYRPGTVLMVTSVLVAVATWRLEISAGRQAALAGTLTGPALHASQ
jgi:hypothetical protein